MDPLYRTNDGSSLGHHYALMPSVGSTCEKIMVRLYGLSLGRISKLMKSACLRERNSAMLPRTTIPKSLLLPLRKNPEVITVRWAT